MTLRDAYLAVNGPYRSQSALDAQSVADEAHRLYTRRMWGRLPGTPEQEALYLDQCRRAALRREYGKEI